MSALLKLRKEKDRNWTWESLALHKGVHCYFSTKTVIGREAQAWAASEAVWQGAQGKWISPSVLVRPYLQWCSGTPTQGGRVGSDSRGGHKDDERAGASLLWNRLRVGVVQSGEETAPGRPFCSIPVPKGDYKESWRGAFHKAMEWWDKGTWPQAEEQICCR